MTNRYPAKCCVCDEPIPAGAAAGGEKANVWVWICTACMAAAGAACHGGNPRKVIEAYFAGFADDAGGPADDRDHEDFKIIAGLDERLKTLGKRYLGQGLIDD